MSLATSACGSVKRHGSMMGPGGIGHSPGSRSERSSMAESLSHDMSSHSTVTSSGLSSSSRHGMHHGGGHMMDPSEWEAKEELRIRELEEARARAAQMEKTMRWWSDCTANWREKWSKVRTERNKVREEVRILRTKLEVATKENGHLKREKQELESELERSRRMPEGTAKTTMTVASIGGCYDRCSPVASSPCSIHSLPERDVPMKINNEPIKGTDDSVTEQPNNDFKSLILQSGTMQQQMMMMTTAAPHPSPDMEFFDRIFDGSSGNVTEMKTEISSSEGNVSSRHNNNKKNVSGGGGGGSLMWENITSPDVEYIEQRMSVLQLRLDEASKTIQVEREEKTTIHKSLERVQQDYNDLKLKYEELKLVKQDALKELSQAKAEHQDELDSIRLDLEDEASSRSSMDRRLADLRTQLERLQAENAAEWGKRERLETEKLALERENKKLRIQMADLEERLERKTKTCSTGGEADVKVMQHELHDKNKELADLRHAHGKLKKVLQDKTTELAHAVRRAEQYETEVKKLRCRVEELKKELATAEDEVDSGTNNIRKLQRTNDELQEQVDSLQVQVDHLQTRLRNNSHSLLALRGSNSLLNDGLSEDETAEF